MCCDNFTRMWPNAICGMVVLGPLDELFQVPRDPIGAFASDNVTKFIIRKETCIHVENLRGTLVTDEFKCGGQLIRVRLPPMLGRLGEQR